MPQGTETSGTAEVRAVLARLEGERRFVIENVGSVSARDVRITFEPKSGRNSPVVGAEVERKFPLAELAPGQIESLLAIVTTGTGIRFRIGLSWSNPDGSRDERRFDLSA
jgi:hypothetical protein